MAKTKEDTGSGLRRLWTAFLLWYVRSSTSAGRVLALRLRVALQIAGAGSEGSCRAAEECKEERSGSSSSLQVRLVRSQGTRKSSRGGILCLEGGCMLFYDVSIILVSEEEKKMRKFKM
jgi:hypothetical protein